MGDGLPADAQGGSEAVDARVLDELRETVGGDDGFFEELLRTYVSDGAAQLDTMKRDGRTSSATWQRIIAAAGRVGMRSGLMTAAPRVLGPSESTSLRSCRARAVGI